MSQGAWLPALFGQGQFQVSSAPAETSTTGSAIRHPGIRGNFAGQGRRELTTLETDQMRTHNSASLGKQCTGNSYSV